LFCAAPGAKPALAPAGAQIRELPHGDDGFVYLSYAGEDTFGG